MKVSKEQKEKTRRKLVEAAIKLFMEKGYQKTTMKQIAKAAEVGDATIYKYFPSKVKILLAYYEIKAADTVKEVRAIESFDDNYELQEKIQILIDTFLLHLLPDREFVDESLKMIFHTPLFLFKDIAPIKKEFTAVLRDFFDDAREKEEIPSSPFQFLIPELVSDYIISIVFYWLKDDSEEFANTTQVVDMSVGLGVLVLKSDILGKGAELISFLIKTHIFRSLEDGHDFLDKLNLARQFFQGGK